MGMHTKENFATTRHKARAPITATTGMYALGNGRTTNKRAKGMRSSRMARSTRGCTKGERDMVTESTNGGRGASTRATLSKTSSTAREFTSGTHKSTPENGTTPSCMGTVLSSHEMENAATLVSSTTVSNTVTANTSNRTAESTKAAGSRVTGFKASQSNPMAPARSSQPSNRSMSDYNFLILICYDNSFNCHRSSSARTPKRKRTWPTRLLREGKR